MYEGSVVFMPALYVHDLFGTESDDYKRLMIELNTASQHLLIEMERVSQLNRRLTETEHQELMNLYDRQIAAQSALQRLLHSHYDGTEYVG